MFGSPEFGQPAHPPARVDPGQAFPQHLGIDEEPVVAKEIREPAAIGVRRLAVGFETDVTADQQSGQSLVSFARKRRGGFKAAPELRSVDAKQPHAARVPEFDGVSIEDALHGIVVCG